MRHRSDIMLMVLHNHMLLACRYKKMPENENEIVEDSNSKVYELGYLLAPSIAEEDVPMNYGNLKDLILSLGGELSQMKYRR